MAKKKLTGDSLRSRLHQLLEADHFDEDVRKKILDLGPGVVTLLQAYATGSIPGEDRNYQARAIITLGEVKKPHGKAKQDECIPVLAKCLHDPDSDMRVRAMMALGNIKGEKAAKELAAVVESKDSSHLEMAQAVRQLGKIKSKTAVTALAALNEKKTLAKAVKDEVKRTLKRK